mmetsp:Transcript_19711/g.49480  ORF Transcript_19711/g.49480 Transcript_19711/m.49480 type:complete len:290 (+) Transcript_19711:1259-2128(+)
MPPARCRISHHIARSGSRSEGLLRRARLRRTRLDVRRAPMLLVRLGKHGGAGRRASADVHPVPVARAGCCSRVEIWNRTATIPHRRTGPGPRLTPPVDIAQPLHSQLLICGRAAIQTLRALDGFLREPSKIVGLLLHVLDRFEVARDVEALYWASPSAASRSERRRRRLLSPIVLLGAQRARATHSGARTPSCCTARPGGGSRSTCTGAAPVRRPRRRRVVQRSRSGSSCSSPRINSLARFRARCASLKKFVNRSEVRAVAWQGSEGRAAHRFWQPPRIGRLPVPQDRS